MTPILPSGEGWAAIRLWIEQTEQRLATIENPAGPVPAYACTRARLPAPAGFVNGVVRITDLNILGVSDGVNWIRQDTGAIV